MFAGATTPEKSKSNSNVFDDTVEYKDTNRGAAAGPSPSSDQNKENDERFLIFWISIIF